MADRLPIVLNGSGNLQEIDTATDGLDIKLEHLSDMIYPSAPAAGSKIAHNGTYWISVPGGGICAFRTSDLTLTTVSTWYVIPWNTEDIKWGNLTHSTSINPEEIVVATPGVIRICATVSLKYDSGTLGIAHIKMQQYTGVLWADIPGTERAQVVRNTTGVHVSMATSMIHNFATSTKFRIVAKREGGAVTTIPAYFASIEAEYVCKN